MSPGILGKEDAVSSNTILGSCEVIEIPICLEVEESHTMYSNLMNISMSLKHVLCS